MSTELKNLSVLVVDDETDLRDMVADALSECVSRVESVGDIDSAWQACERFPFDLMISDIRMPSGSGVDLMKRILARPGNRTRSILMTGFLETSEQEILQLGAVAVLFKPFRFEQLLSVLERVIQGQR